MAKGGQSSALGANDLHKKTDDLIRECVLEGLVSVVGESGAQSIIYYLQKDYGVDYDKICHAPQDFISSLKAMLSSGADPIISRIIEKLKNKVGPELPDNLAKAIQGVHRIYERLSA